MQGALCLPQQGPQGCFPSAWPPTLCVPTASSPRPAHHHLKPSPASGPRCSWSTYSPVPQSPSTWPISTPPTSSVFVCLMPQPRPLGIEASPAPSLLAPGPVPAAWRPALSVVVQLHSSVLGPSPGVGRGVPLCCRSSGPMAPQCLTLSHFCCSSVHVTPHFTSRQPRTVTYLTGRPGLRVGSPRLSGSEPSLPCCPPSLPCFPLFGHSCNGQASPPSTHTQCCPQRSLRCPLTQTPMCPGGWWPEAQAPAGPPAGLWVAPSALQVGPPAG